MHSPRIEGPYWWPEWCAPGIVGANLYSCISSLTDYCLFWSGPSPIFDAIEYASCHLCHIQFVCALQADQGQGGTIHILLAGKVKLVMMLTDVEACEMQIKFKFTSLRIVYFSEYPTDLIVQLLGATLQLFPVGVQALHQSINIDRIGQVVLAIPGGQRMFHLDGG